MKKPKKITKVTVYSLSILGCLFLFLPLTVYMVYGNYTKHTSFYCYTWDHQPYFYVCEVVFVVCLAPFMPFYIIGTFEPLEYFETYKKFLMNNEGEISTYKLVFIRSVGTLVTVAFCMLSNDVSQVTEFAGNLFNPLVGFIIPIFMVHAKAYWIDKKRKSVLRIMHDGAIFAFSVFMMGYGTYHQINHWITGKKD